MKTILRLLPLCLTLWLLGCSLALFHPLTYASVYPPDWKRYVSRLLSLFTYHHYWCGMVWTVLYEFLLYPVIRNRLPSILRRIGIISLFITVLSIVFLILELLQNNYYNHLVAIKYVTIVLNSISRGVITMLLASTMLELVCAQAPYNMRGLFGGCMVLVLLSSIIIGYCIPSNITLTIYGLE